jgi:hypothetical protein
MSVRTTADEKIDSAADHVRAAVGDLHAIIVEKCWGHDEYNREYYVELCSSYTRLVDVLKAMHR